MLNKKIDTEEIERKNKVVDHAISVLKTEFIGIDKQIDEIMDNGFQPSSSSSIENDDHFVIMMKTTWNLE